MVRVVCRLQGAGPGSIREPVLNDDLAASPARGLEGGKVVRGNDEPGCGGQRGGHLGVADETRDREVTGPCVRLDRKGVADLEAELLLVGNGDVDLPVARFHDGSRAVQQVVEFLVLRDEQVVDEARCQASGFTC